ncbi:MAG: OmpA family protein [Polyangiaceae bacterium]
MSQSLRFTTVLLAMATCAVLALSCAETKPPTTAVAGERQAVASTSEPRAIAQTTSDIHISDDIRSKCGISDADAYFAFNSSLVTTRARTPLELVVRCFTSGPLRGHAVKLVGRADPRGPSEYNVTLGQWRADAVEGYLTTRGLQKSKAVATSRGAMDASGSDEQTWQHDRRVDVMLGD